MALYSCRVDGDQYRITKFDTDLNVQSSYLCTETECDCPAGVRPMCRHREMLPAFIQRPAVGNGWFLDYDQGGWYEYTDRTEEVGFLEGMTQTVTHTTLYMQDGSVQEIDHTQPHSTTVSVSDFDSEDGGSNPPAVAKPPLPAWRRSR